MILFELKNPREYKYGQTLNQSEIPRCVRETPLSPRWQPYPRRTVEVENISGTFSGTYEASLMDPRLANVCFKVPTPFGMQKEIYHVNGHVSVMNAPGLKKAVNFKGVKGFKRVMEIALDLLMPEGSYGAVHMGVFSSCIGKRLQTSEWGYLENRIRQGISWLQIEARIEQNNVIRLSVVNWDAVGLPQPYRPIGNDMVITGKGSILHRFKWPSMQWTLEAEHAVIEACQRTSDFIGSIC